MRGSRPIPAPPRSWSGSVGSTGTRSAATRICTTSTTSIASRSSCTASSSTREEQDIPAIVKAPKEFKDLLADPDVAAALSGFQLNPPEKTVLAINDVRNLFDFSPAIVDVLKDSKHERRPQEDLRLHHRPHPARPVRDAESRNHGRRWRRASGSSIGASPSLTPSTGPRWPRSSNRSGTSLARSTTTAC